MAATKMLKNAYIDWRFDQPNDITLLGKSVTSFASTKIIVDQIKRDGFNGIVLNTNVPIDPETGALVMYDPREGASNPNKNIPKDTWSVVKYAKKLGLNVTINMGIVDYKDDSPITTSSVGGNFSTETFFNSVATYESKIAALAGKNGVNTFGVGYYQSGFEDKQYQTQWQNVVDKVHKVFKGKLSYTTDYRSDNALWSIVDVVGAGASSDGASGAIGNLDSLYNQYKKPVYLDNVQVNGSMGADAQAAQIRDILKAAIGDHPSSLGGVAFYEFAPWKQADWIQNPKSDADRQWADYAKNGSDFVKNSTAETAFLNWLNYSTADVNGTKKNDTLNVYAGDKKIDGGLGVDTVVIHTKAKDVNVQNLGSGHFSIEGGMIGHFDVYNVEALRFDDISKVSLLGHQDYSKFNWGSW